MKFAVLAVVLVACTKPNPGVCCETEIECTRIGLAPDAFRSCTEGEAVCVANVCVAGGCDGDEDCRDPGLPFCVAGTCSTGCDGNEDCLDADFPVCINNMCSVDCNARGGQIVFDSDRDGDPDLLVMFADGFGARQVLPNSTTDRNARWSPDASKIAFSGDTDGDFDVFVFDLVSPLPLDVSRNSGLDDHVEWSPDGTRLAFDSQGVSLTAHTVKPDGSELSDLVGMTGSENGEPSWAPDSLQVTFRSLNGDTTLFDIWTSASDGSGTVQRTNETSRSNRGPKWSPDGTMIAYFSSAGVSVMTSTGANQTVIVPTASPIADLAWSPDSTRILFVRTEGGNKDIWVVNADGSGPTQLTTSPTEDSRPRWSPDGQNIVFETDRDGNFEVYRMAPDGSNPTNLTNNPADDRGPDWGVCPSSS